jgi:uncharacterized membrane protein YedE/YeeE
MHDFTPASALSGGLIIGVAASRRFWLPTRSDLDARLIAGAMIFGAGWALGGYCPGPGIVSLAGGGSSALIFVAAMIAGMFVTAKLQGALSQASQPSSTPGQSTTPLAHTDTNPSSYSRSS